MSKKTYITADLHFTHSNVIKYCPETRGQYADAQDMNERMIAEWNSIVHPADTVYILGDFAFDAVQNAVNIAKRLNGRKILIIGNHDEKLVKNEEFRACFAEVHQYLKIRHNGSTVIMFHYPINSWDMRKYGSIHFFGHLHQTPHNMVGRCMNVGVDATGKIVSDMDELISQMNAIQATAPHH